MDDIATSQPVEWVGQAKLGFVINVAFSSTNAALLSSWLHELRHSVADGLYTMPADGLHITVLDWIAPLYDYDGTDKRALFEAMCPQYEAAFTMLTAAMAGFEVRFDTVRVTPGAVILTGHDAGQFAALRKAFMGAITLPAGAKAPPDIIHATLARFVPPAIPLKAVETYVAAHPLKLTQPIDRFRLIETRREPMQDFTVLREFALAG